MRWTKKSSLHQGDAGDSGSGDFGRRLGRQLQLELLDLELEFPLGLGVAGQQQFESIRGQQMDIDHLASGEFVECAARG
jgi:hypothetical protein